MPFALSRRPLALALTLSAGLLATGSAQAFDIKAMSPDEKAAFGDAVRDYLVNNPKVLMEAINALEGQQQQQQAANDSDLVAANADQLFHDDWSYVGGNPEGDVTVVEFLDYRCGYCRKAHEEVMNLVKNDGNIRYVVKEFPILTQDSVTAARFAISVLQNVGPEAYAKVNNAFYTDFQGPYSDAGFTKLAKSLGFDAKPALDGMDDAAVDKVLAQNHALAQRLQIQGTPTFVMGDQMLRGYAPEDVMKQVVSEARS